MVSEKRYKTALKIFFEIAKRSIQITAGGLVNVVLATFKVNCKFAYSLYVLFKKIQPEIMCRH
jgi:hypothetical protein